MEKRRKMIIIVFLLVSFILFLLLGILSYKNKNDETGIIINNKTIEEDVNVNKLVYKVITNENGIFDETDFNIKEDKLLLGEKEISSNFNNVKIYIFDDLKLLYYEEDNFIKVILYDKDNNIILENKDILTSYKNYIISKFSISDIGLIFNLSYKKEECENTNNVVVMYKYIEKNKLSERTILNEDNKECIVKDTGDDKNEG